MIPIRGITNPKIKVKSKGFSTTRNRNESSSRRTTRRSRWSSAMKAVIFGVRRLDGAFNQVRELESIEKRRQAAALQISLS
jgi:hypothetical protein